MKKTRFTALSLLIFLMLAHVAPVGYAENGNDLFGLNLLENQILPEPYMPLGAEQERPFDAERYAGGNGTEQSPFLIENAEQLTYLAQSTNNGATYIGKHFLLAADIDLAGVNWTPIGNYIADIAEPQVLEGSWGESLFLKDFIKRPERIVAENAVKYAAFKGNFDGNGHTVTGLHIERNNEDYIGLFGYVLGDIKNLVIRDVTLLGHQYVGAIAGYSEGNIENCRSSGKVVGAYCVGGLVGQHMDGAVENSTSYCIVRGIEEIGGIIGHAESESITDSAHVGALVAVVVPVVWSGTAKRKA